MLNNITLLIGITLMYATPLVFGALGGVISSAPASSISVSRA